MGIHIMPPLYEIVIKPVPPLPPGDVFYPSPCPNSPVDGDVRRYITAGVSWSDIHDGPGTEGYPCAYGIICYILPGSLANQYTLIQRDIILFDLATIPPDHSIIAATLDLWVSSKIDQHNDYPQWAVYSSNPNSNSTLIPSDYGTLGTTPLSEILSHAQITAGQYNAFNFNQAGLDYIIPGSIIKLGVREAKYDAPNNPPTWHNLLAMGLSICTVESPSNHPPRLTVWHQAP
jgi:hypothetical protein